jgi:hypothetical protein
MRPATRQGGDPHRQGEPALLGNTSVLGAASREFFAQQSATLAGLWAQKVRVAVSAASCASRSGAKAESTGFPIAPQQAGFVH